MIVITIFSKSSQLENILEKPSSLLSLDLIIHDNDDDAYSRVE